MMIRKLSAVAAAFLMLATMPVPPVSAEAGSDAAPGLSAEPAADYFTRLSYDKQPLTVGETRCIVYSSSSYLPAGGVELYGVPDNVTVEVDQARHCLYVTAHAPGEVSFDVRENSTAFSAQVRLTITEAPTTIVTTLGPYDNVSTWVEYDQSTMVVGERRKVCYWNSMTGLTTGVTIKNHQQRVTIEDDPENGCFYVTALLPGEANLWVQENSTESFICVGLTILPDTSGTATATATSFTTVTTTTTTTTVPGADPIGTTTAVPEIYSTKVCYEDGPMQVGERRRIYYYNSKTMSCTGFSTTYVDPEELLLEDDQDAGCLWVTALKPGHYNFWVYEMTCNFGAEVVLNVEDPAATTTAPAETTTTVTTSTSYVYNIWVNHPVYKTHYHVGEAPDLTGGLMGVTIYDQDGNFVDYYHQPMDAAMFRVEYDAFTAPGVYEIQIIRRTTGDVVTRFDVLVTGSDAAYDFYVPVGCRDPETYKLVPVSGVPVRLAEYACDQMTNKPTGEPLRILAEWVSDEAELPVIPVDEIDPEHYYQAEILELPAGWRNSDDYTRRVVKGLKGAHLQDSYMGSSLNDFALIFEAGEPGQEWTYPKDMTETVSIQLVDEDTGLPIPGLDIEVVELAYDYGTYIPGKTIGSYNSSETPVYEFTYDFHFTSADDICDFGLRVKSLPAGYQESAQDRLTIYNGCLRGQLTCSNMRIGETGMRPALKFNGIRAQALSGEALPDHLVDRLGNALDTKDYFYCKQENGVVLFPANGQPVLVTETEESGGVTYAQTAIRKAVFRFTADHALTPAEEDFGGLPVQVEAAPDRSAFCYVTAGISADWLSAAAQQLCTMDGITEFSVEIMESGDAQTVLFCLGSGDLNGDGDVNVKDAVLLARVIAEDRDALPAVQQLAAADIDGDDHYSIDDLTALLKRLIL